MNHGLPKTKHVIAKAPGELAYRCSVCGRSWGNWQLISVRELADPDVELGDCPKILIPGASGSGGLTVRFRKTP
jgi:hypothetical protein